MVFLGGAVLANLVRIDLFLESISPKAKQYTYISPDCRQGRYVGIQTGVAGTGRACSGKAWSAVNRMYLGGCFVVSFLFFFFRLVLLRTLPHYLQAVLPCFFPDPLCRYPSHFVPYLIASSILCLDWSGAGGLGPLK